MRQHVLDQEFLQLPAIVRELQQAVAQLTQVVHDYIAATDARLERLENDVAELKTGQAQLVAGQAQLVAGQAQLVADQSQLAADQSQLAADQSQLAANQAQMAADQSQMAATMARLEGNMNRLIGTDYERKAARRASRLANRYLGLADLRVIYAVTLPDNNQLPELLDDAIRAGRINASEADELEEADIVMRGPSEYAIVEVSVTLDESDIQRAQERARLLSQATTKPARALAIGARALDSAAQSAATNSVAIMILSQ